MYGFATSIANAKRMPLQPDALMPERALQWRHSQTGFNDYGRKTVVIVQLLKSLALLTVSPIAGKAMN
jgi:hypothetical protein